MNPNFFASLCNPIPFAESESIIKKTTTKLLKTIYFVSILPVVSKKAKGDDGDICGPRF